MRFKAKIKLGEGFKQILFVPFLNIIILLVFIFVFSAGFILRPGLKFNLPVSVSGSMLDFEELELIIKADSTIYLNGNVVSAEELKPVFKEAAKRRMGVLIKAQSSVPLSKIAEVCDYARLSGIRAVNIGTD
ncbi:MAG: biopolymer transporter ExbD [Candidatus Omnitrophota bacterium]|jgi:biopolymer transport protein ExbD